MRNKIVLTSALSVLIVGCSTTPYKAPQSQVDSYFDNITLSPQGGEVEHKNHGRMKATEKPYAKDYDECQGESFKGKSFLFGTREVSNPKHLTQFSNDYLQQIVTAMLAYKNSSGSGAHAGAMAATSVATGSSMPSTNYTQYSKTIFDDKEILSNLNGINDLEKATLECVKAKGWVYIETKK
jgi:GTP:adenosylcobinamide-phosphate guanylyltransferase